MNLKHIERAIDFAIEEIRYAISEAIDKEELEEEFRLIETKKLLKEAADKLY